MITLPPNPPHGFETLTPDEQIDYVHALWRHITSSPTTLSVPGWHLNVINVRLTDFQNTPVHGKSWGEIHAAVIHHLNNPENSQ